MYIPYHTSSHEQTGDIINFAHFEEGYLLKSERNSEEDKSISSSISDSSTDNDYDEGYRSTNFLDDIKYGSQIHSDINARAARFNFFDRINKKKFYGNEKSSQRRIWAKVYRKSLSML